MTDTSTKSRAPLWQRLWPVYLIAAGLLAGWRLGLFDYLSLQTLREQHEALRSFVEGNLLIAVAAYVIIYALSTLFMVPGALWITIAGGFLFGLAGGSAATVVGATLGARLDASPPPQGARPARLLLRLLAMLLPCPSLPPPASRHGGAERAASLRSSCFSASLRSSCSAVASLMPACSCLTAIIAF